MALPSEPWPTVRDFERLVRNWPIALASMDDGHRIRFCNRAFEQLFQYPTSEILGRPLVTLLGLEQNVEVRDAMARLAEGEPVHVVTRARRKDQSDLFVEFDGVPKAATGAFVGSWGLFHDVTQRRRTEQRLRLSRQILLKAFEASPTTVALSTAPENRLLSVNRTWERLTGYHRHEAIGRTPVELGLFEDPLDFERLNAQIDANGGWIRDVECRFRSRDGQRVVGSVSVEDFVINGTRRRIAVVADITRLRTAERTLSAVTQRMIDAQEWERLRIARDLHDDIGQRLVVWELAIERLRRDLASDGIVIDERLLELQRMAERVSADIRSLSRELHSPSLSLLTIDKALKRLSDDLSTRLGIDIEFTNWHVPRSVPEDISLCLFRVLQEGLTNAAKHSGSTRAAVALTGTPDAIQLKIRDFGSGLAGGDALGSRGLGLVTMRERVAMVNGTFAIESPSGGGTEITISIPLAAERKKD